MRARVRKSRVHQVHHLPVLIHPDISGGFWAQCPTLPGCYTQGETIDETLLNMREAIDLCLEELSPQEIKALDQEVSVHMLAV